MEVIGVILILLAFLILGWVFPVVKEFIFIIIRLLLGLIEWIAKLIGG